MLGFSVVTSLPTFDSSTQMIVTVEFRKITGWTTGAYPMLHDCRLIIGLSCALPGHMTDMLFNRLGSPERIMVYLEIVHYIMICVVSVLIL